MARGGVVLLVALSILGLAPLPTASGKRPKRHSTCGTFCKQAGGLGGDPGVPPCKTLGQVIRANAGIASVTVLCHGRNTSRGAVVIYPHDLGHDYVNDGVPQGSYGGADLIAAPQHRVTLRILLSPKTVALLRRKHPLIVDVLIELDTKPVVQADTKTGLRLVRVIGSGG